MTDALHIAAYPRAALSPAQYEEIVALCTRAFGSPFGSVMDSFEDATHVIAMGDERIVSHALWIPRTLIYNGTPLRSAYVVAGATEAGLRRRGYSAAVLRAIHAGITSFDLGALATSYTHFCRSLGWESWRGPLGVETADGIVPTPTASVMIFRLPNGPSLDLDGALTTQWRPGDVW